MKEMSEYNQQQIEAILMVRGHLSGLSASRLRRLRQKMSSYLEFRKDLSSFQKTHLAELCSQKCFTSRTSACCGREGIITFFADVVINVLLSTDGEIDTLLEALQRDTGGSNCVYLNEAGCIWHCKPIVCEMFLCDHAKGHLLAKNDTLVSQWEKLRQRERFYTWPDRLVLFDKLEDFFIRDGFDSPLMYMHRSPGLLRLKAKHGV